MPPPVAPVLAGIPGVSRLRSRRVGQWCAPIGLSLAAFYPAVARADVGVPMLAFVWPSAWVLFIPICLVEAYVAKRLSALPFGECAKLAVVANAWSTLVGIPLTWFALLLLEIAVGLGISSLPSDATWAWILLAPLHAAWLPPTTVHWHLYGAAALLCIPFLFVSIRVERWSAGHRLSSELARRWARAANLATYIPIFLVLSLLAVIDWNRAR
jgi:hypothetical protein